MIYFINVQCLGFLQGKEKWDDTVVTLVPGEEVEVQVTIKYAISESARYWSRWSQPVRAVAPQSAGVSK